MSYGLLYQCNFDPVGNVPSAPVFNLNILQKNYDGGSISVIGSGIPALHIAQTDDPRAPIKGTSLRINLINSGNLPLTRFLTDDDTMFMGQFYSNGQLMFQGYMVLDDCSEYQFDYTHEISLSFTDNLGLLKGIALNKAPANYQPIYSTMDRYYMTAPHLLSVPTSVAQQVLIGDQIQIGSNFYTVQDNSGGIILIVLETVTTETWTEALITLYRQTLIDKMTLGQIIKTCLLATNMQLNIHVFAHLNETTQPTSDCFLTNILIDPATFITGNNTTSVVFGININQILFQDCYTVLTNVLARFNMVLFQALGIWNIIRWDELKNYSNLIPSFIFDSNFTPISSGILLAPVRVQINLPPAILPNTYPEAGLLHRVVRGYEFDIETFNYKHPGLQIKNADFSQLGPLIRLYYVTVWITGDQVVHYTNPGVGSGPYITELWAYYEYVAQWWYYTDAIPSASGANGPAVYFIRVVLDTLQTERDRYMVVTRNHIHSYQIEASNGDEFTFSFSVRTPDHDWEGGLFQIICELTNGTKTYYPHAIGEAGDDPATPGWGTGYGFAATVSGNPELDFVNISITTRPIPFDGILTFYLQRQSYLANNETWYKDLKLDYTPVVNGSTQIVGQTHVRSTPNLIKQNKQIEVYADSCPRNSIAGSLFISGLTNLIQNRAAKWQRSYNAESMNLGEITTEELMSYSRGARTILEGSIRSNQLITLLTVFTFDQFPGLYFVAGKLEIDYRNNRYTGTWFEVWNDSDGPLTSNYLFNFIFNSI